MYYVVYTKSNEKRATKWDAFNKANSFAIYLLDLANVYGVELLTAEEMASKYNSLIA